MLTKTGADLAYLDSKIVGGVKSLFDRMRNPATRKVVLESTAKKTKSVLHPFYSGSRAVVNAASKGVDAVAHGVYNNPKYVLPAATAMAIGAYKFPRDLRVNLLHADPNIDVTQRTGLTGVRMRDGFSAEQVGKNLYY